MTKKEKEYYTKKVMEIRQRIKTGTWQFGDHRLLKDYEAILNYK